MLNRMTILALRFLVAPPATNPFPLRRMPEHLGRKLASMEERGESANPPVPVPRGFRGKIAYDRSACIGCRLCVKVCPARAIAFKPEEKKVEIRTDRCCFCEQCVQICPVKCLWMTEEFLLISVEDRAESLVTDSGERPK
jgi:ferredoxin